MFCSYYERRPPPTKTLIQHIKRRDWVSAKLRTLTYPWDAHYKKSGNNLTPMHLVCLYRAPRDLVELLLDANPSALFEQDSEGWTPIHLVLLYGGDEETALLLIRRGGAPAVSVQSPFAGSPLHLACRHGSAITILEELVRTNQRMATTPNENGTRPAEAVWSQFLRNPDNIHFVQLLNKKGESGVECIDPTNSAIEDLVQRLTLLVQAAKDGQPDQEAMLLSDILKHQWEVGDLTEFLDVAITLFPDQVQARDRSGNFLLHIAASTPAVPKSKFARRPGAINLDTIDVLVGAYPEASEFPNNDGDLPLHLALKSGRRTWQSGVASLVEANSEALHRKDRETYFYPFQLAAAFPSGREEESLTTVFELLLACPHVLTH